MCQVPCLQALTPSARQIFRGDFHFLEHIYEFFLPTGALRTKLCGMHVASSFLWLVLFLISWSSNIFSSLTLLVGVHCPARSSSAGTQRAMWLAHIWGYSHPLPQGTLGMQVQLLPSHHPTAGGERSYETNTNNCMVFWVLQRKRPILISSY